MYLYIFNYINPECSDTVNGKEPPLLRRSLQIVAKNVFEAVSAYKVKEPKWPYDSMIRRKLNN